MLNKALDPDDDHRLQQSISEWGPGGVSGVQEEEEGLGLSKLCGSK